MSVQLLCGALVLALIHSEFLLKATLAELELFTF